ncbi:hypothetical protein DMA11_00100 [Marinilabiliaceae bacterium JC017]|nr:hypothetical protein DMA11_00100 [Marinilabiliaceae bacterium JC017]
MEHLESVPHDLMSNSINTTAISEDTKPFSEDLESLSNGNRLIDMKQMEIHFIKEDRNEITPRLA